MSRSTISTFQLFEMFPDEESARLYLESRLWPDGTVCPECKSRERITVRRGGYYRCNASISTHWKGHYENSPRTGYDWELYT